jgi:hypothetical protein
MMFTGDVIYVEDIQQHDVLMGSDMTRRTVADVYPLDWAHPSPMYQINAMGNTGRIPPNGAHSMPFVVTADHILVIRIDNEPALSCQESRNQYTSSRMVITSRRHGRVD